MQTEQYSVLEWLDRQLDTEQNGSNERIILSMLIFITLNQKLFINSKQTISAAHNTITKIHFKAKSLAVTLQLNKNRKTIA